MKKHLLTTWLLSIMMVLGAGSAWAQSPYFSQDYEGDGVTADWTSNNTGRYTVDMNTVEGNTFLTVNAVSNGNNGTDITCTSLVDKVATDADFTLEFDLQITDGNNQASSFYIYDSANAEAKPFFSLVAPSANGTKWNLQGSADNQVTLAKTTWFSFKIAKVGAITYLTLKNKNTGDVIKDKAVIPTLSEAGGLGKMVFHTKRYYAYMAIDNVVLRDVEEGDAPVSVPTTYTIKYQDANGTTLKEDAVVNSIVGLEVSASSDQTADFKVGEGETLKKWIYVSGNNVITTVEDGASNIITLIYREASIFNYTFTAKAGETLLETYASATGFENDRIAVPYHHYYNVEGTLYQKDATSSEYNYSFVLDADNKAVGISDYAITDKTNVIYFSEAEDIPTISHITDGLQASRNSFAGGGYAAKEIKLIYLNAGTYKLTAAAYGGAYTFKYGESTILDMEQAGYWRELSSDEFTLTETTPIMFKGGNGATGALDYIIIQSENGSIREAPNKSIFLAPGPWNVDGARYAAYTWNDNGNKWFDFAAAEEEGVYTVAIPEYYTGLILARINPNGTDEDPWKNVWNQTADIDFTEVADSTLFTITGWGEGTSPYETSKYAPTVAPVLNTYTATFTTNAGWEKVYAYVWTGEGQDKVLGEWPGTELTATEGVYAVTIQAENAPEFIIFNNGLENEALQQTADLAFENGKAYEYTVEEPAITDYTEFIINADLTGEGGFDATGTKGISGGIVKVGNAAAFDFKQTIANLPAGKYKVTAQAAYRYGADEAAEAAAIAAETDTKLVQLYATVGEKTVSAKVQNRYDGASETDYANGNGSVTVNEKFVPNTSDAVKAWFDAGKYVNEVIFNLPADGAVTIGINRTGTPESDYTVIGPWTLTRLGDAEEEPEPEVPTLANGDFEGEYTVYSNPSGDRAIYQPEGWTVSYNNGDSNDMTALNSECLSWNNFENKPQLSETGGNNTYWVRFRWGNSETLTLSQEVTLAAGTYKLSADAFFNGANGAAATISAAGQSAAITGNSTWANHKIVFTVTEEGPVTIALNFIQTQQVENIAAFDNVKLETYDPMEGAKDELLAAITAAKAIETEGKAGVEELNAAITDAETALNNAEATVESLNAAKTALAAAIAEFEDINITVPALAGWTRVRTTNIENTADNYYVLVDANSLNYVMANEADHYRPCYKTVADPVANPSFVWSLEGSDNTFALKSFSTGSYFVQADGWNTSMTGATGSATFQFTQNDGVYSIKCVQSNALVGHWNDSGAAVAEDGENIAANKQAKDAPGFYLFAMPKATYEAAILAARTEATAGASKENGIDVTAWIQNADWTGDYGGWARSGSWGNMQWGQKTLEVWNATNVVVKQTLTAVPDGTYKLTADVISGNGDNKVAFVYGTGGATVKSDAVTAEASAGNYNTMSAEVAGNTLTADNIVVTGGMLTVGLDIAAGWIVADNFKLYYYGEDMSQYAQAYHDALTAAQAIDATAPMNGDVLSALNTALTTYASVDETDKATLLAAATALSTATEAATASIAAYAKAAEMLPKMKQLTEETNVYTAEALASYYTQWADKYEAKTLTTEEANALQNPYTQTGWQHDANMKFDDLLLSAWSFGDVKAKDYETALYINTWSTEGNNDGSEFRVPFFEYWTNDANSLGEKTLTATMSNLPEGKYNVTTLVRVRIKNGAETPAAGITLQANEGEAVNVTGDQVGETQMYLKEVTATGTVAEDGVLKIKFNVAADNNISWLSFKNVKFTKVEPAEPVYYVVGTMNNWTPSDEYKMTLNEEAEGVVEYMLTLDLEANAELKVVKGNKDVWYPDGMDNNYVIDADGTYTIYFRPNYDGGDDWYYNVLYVSKKENAQPEFPENVIYSWESPEGTPVEYGGTIEHLYGKDNRLNYPNSGYYTICLNGKKANVNDTAVDESKDAASRMVITLGNAVAKGDTIAITGYITKSSSSKSSAWIVFENGATAESAVFGDESNIFVPEGGEATGAINTKYVIVSAEAAGSKTITLTRGQTGTNLFITKLQIMQYDPTTGISIVKTAIENGAIYNLNGQKVNKAQKGLYIINGKKVVIK